MELRNLTPENFAEVEALRRQYEDRLETILRDGAVGVKADVKIDELAQAIHRALAGVIVAGRKQVVHMVLQQAEQQRLLVRRVIIQCARLHPDFRRQCPHGYGSKAVTGEKPQRRRADFGPSDVRM